MTKNITQLPAAATLDGTEVLPAIQAGADVKATASALAAPGNVRLIGDQTVAGVKTFANSPVVPDGSWSIADTSGLQTALNTKAADADVAHDTGNETWAGVKTFSSSPVVPAASWAIAATSGLQTALDGKVNDTGNESVAGVKTFTDSPVIPTPTTAGQAANKSYVDSRSPVFAVGPPSGGGTGSDNGAITAAVAAATASARGGVVMFSGGLYNYTGGPIVLPESGATGKQVTLQGAGGGNGTIIYTPTDGTAGQYLIAGSGASSASNGSYKTVVRDLTFFGPDTFDAYSTSRIPCELSGVMLDTHVSIYNCTFLGFRYGFNSAGNHNVIRDSKFSNCYFGARFTAVAGLGGDVLLDNVDVAGNTLGSVSIANNAVATWHAVKGHYGFAPWAIYIESGAAAGTLNMYYCKFDGTSFEYLGNGLIYNPGQTSRVDEVHWQNCANFSTNNATYGLPASTFERYVYLHGFTNFSFQDGAPAGTVTDSMFDVSTSISGAIQPCLAGISSAAAAVKPYIKGPAGSNQAQVRLIDNNFRGVAVPCDSSNAVTAKTLVEWTQFGAVRPHAQWGTGIRTQIAGVAMNGMAASNREYVLVAQESPDQEILMTGGVDPTSTQVLVPSSDATNRSWVMPFSWDGTNATRQIVGQLYLAVAGSASVRARVRFL